jgi:hypothetical protein
VVKKLLRWAGLAILFASGMAQAQQPPVVRRAPAPMFSSAYVAALQGILELEPKDVAALDARLSRNPGDFAARLKLIAYCMRADRAALEESRVRRAELILWLVEHQPDSEILASPYAALGPADLKPDQLQRAMRLWRAATEMSKSDSRVMWNAANFYRQNDRGLYVESLEKAVALAPGNEPSARELGLLYAGAILTVNPQAIYRDASGADPALARRAAQELDTTGNPLLLEPAVRLFQSEYNRSLMMGRENRSVGDLAQRYFAKAKALDPGMDEAFVFPKIQPDMVGMMSPGARPPDTHTEWDAAEKQIRRLPPSAFPGLPQGIATALRSRGCTVPQPSADGAPKSAIRGEFFAKGQEAWAVLCSAGGSSSILVFRGRSGAKPEELAKGEDKNYLQGWGPGKIVYSREIDAVGQKYILDHYRAYGGPEPPPIDHQGIDDIFVGKASVTFYWYNGTWRQLQGAD